MMDQDNIQITKNMRSRTMRLEHEGDYWGDDEKRQLQEMFEDGVGITEMAIRLQRTEPAVNQQIEKMDLYGRKGNPIRFRRPRNSRDASACLCERCGADPALCPRCEAAAAVQEDT